MSAFLEFLTFVGFLPLIGTFLSEEILISDLSDRVFLSALVRVPALAQAISLSGMVIEAMEVETGSKVTVLVKLVCLSM